MTVADWVRRVGTAVAVVAILGSHLFVIRKVLSMERSIAALSSSRNGAASVVRSVTGRLSLAQSAWKGDRSARIALVEFSDFECPFCAHFARQTLPDLVSDFVESGRIVVGYKHLPLEKVHAMARPAALTTECARRQGRFWPLHDLLFAPNAPLDIRSITNLSRRVGMDEADWNACIVSDSAAEALRVDAADAQSLGITGTPAFALGWLDSTSLQVSVVAVISGAQPFGVFRAAIDGLELGKGEGVEAVSK